MSAIGVMQATRGVVVLAEEQAGVSVLGCVQVEEIIDRPEKALGFVQGHRILSPQVGLQVGHQKSCSNSLPGDIAEHQPEPSCSESQEIVVIASHLAGLDTDTCV